MFPSVVQKVQSIKWSEMGPVLKGYILQKANFDFIDVYYDLGNSCLYILEIAIFGLCRQGNSGGAKARRSERGNYVFTCQVPYRSRAALMSEVPRISVTDKVLFPESLAL